MQPKRPLYAQLLFTVLAFSMMVVLSYIFMSGIVHNHLLRNTRNTLDFGQAQIENTTLGLRLALRDFARTAQSMIMQGDDVEKLQNYISEISNYIRSKGRDSSGFSDFFGYFETLPRGPVFINAVGWNSAHDGYIPADRPWYGGAITANGEISEKVS
jgi:predicted PurR-regulated permease PerM